MSYAWLGEFIHKVRSRLEPDYMRPRLEIVDLTDSDALTGQAASNSQMSKQNTTNRPEVSGKSGFNPSEGMIQNATAPALALLDLKRAKAPSKEQSSRSKPMPGFAPKKGPEGFKQVGLYDPSAKTKGPRKRRRAPKDLSDSELQSGDKPKRRRRRRVVNPQPLCWGSSRPTRQTPSWSPYD